MNYGKSLILYVYYVIIEVLYIPNLPTIQIIFQPNGHTLILASKSMRISELDFKPVHTIETFRRYVTQLNAAKRHAMHVKL